MRTRSSSNLVGESSPNLTSSNLKLRNGRRSKQPFILEESPVDTMVDQRTMGELLRAPTEGYAEEIMVPPILAEHFELNDGNSSSSSEIAKLTHAVNQQTSDVTTAMTAILKQFQVTSPPASVKADPKGELKAITTQSVLVLDGHFVPMPPPFINPDENERVEETLTNLELALLSNKEKLLELANTPLNENCSAVILKKLPEKLEILDYLEDLFATNHISGNPTFSSHIDLTSPEVINLLSGSTTTSSSPDHLLEEFADELALITFPSRNDYLSFDIESDLREIEYFLNHDPTKEMDSILEDSIDECNLANPNDNLVDTIPKIFTDEHTLDYSSQPLYDDYDDDLFEFESDNDDACVDPFDSKQDDAVFLHYVC
nr:reverse transcriptase domain-containing protein [Tanacetum cinerariifolium]